MYLNLNIFMVLVLGCTCCDVEYVCTNKGVSVMKLLYVLNTSVPYNFIHIFTNHYIM